MISHHGDGIKVNTKTVPMQSQPPCLGLISRYWDMRCTGRLSSSIVLWYFISSLNLIGSRRRSDICCVTSAVVDPFRIDVANITVVVIVIIGNNNITVPFIIA